MEQMTVLMALLEKSAKKSSFLGMKRASWIFTYRRCCWWCLVVVMIMVVVMNINEYDDDEYDYDADKYVDDEYDNVKDINDGGDDDGCFDNTIKLEMIIIIMSEIHYGPT